MVLDDSWLIVWGRWIGVDGCVHGMGIGWVGNRGYVHGE